MTLHINSKPTSDYLEAFGAIAIGLTEIESTMKACIKVLTGMNDYKVILCLVGGEPYLILLNKLAGLFRYVVTDTFLLTEFDNIYEELDDVNEKRNDYLHSVYSINPHSLLPDAKEVTFIRFKSQKYFGKGKKEKKKKPRQFVKSEVVSVDMLQSLVTRIDRVNKNLHSLVISNLPEIWSQYRTRQDLEQQMLSVASKHATSKRTK